MIALLALCATVGLASGTKELGAGSQLPASTAEPVFQASHHIAEILEYVHKFSAERTIAVLDFYAGESHLARRARHRGHQAQTYDIMHSPREDVLTRTGYFIGLGLCCSVETLLGCSAIFSGSALTCFKTTTGSQAVVRVGARGVQGNSEDPGGPRRTKEDPGCFQDFLGGPRSIQDDPGKPRAPRDAWGPTGGL